MFTSTKRFYFSVKLKKSGLKTPSVELQEIGPSFDFILRRTHLAEESLYKVSLKEPKALKVCMFLIAYTLTLICLPKDIVIINFQNWRSCIM